MKILFLNDYSYEELQGGANITNHIFIDKGISMGYGIKICTPKDFDGKKAEENLARIKEFDLVVLSNINAFKEETIQWVIENTKYAKLEHDYCFCKSRNGLCGKQHQKCVPAPIFINMFTNSLLNIFFSPLQLNIFKEAFGEIMRDAICIPGPIEKGKFYPDKSKQKDAYLYAGALMTHKGVQQILDFADSQKSKRFHFAGRAVNKEILDRINNKHTYLGEISYDKMPELYRQYKYFVINPQMPESFGLCIMEAFASGCEIIKFEKSHQTGFESYNLSKEEMYKKCIDAPNVFWQKVEEATKCQKVKKQFIKNYYPICCLY